MNNKGVKISVVLPVYNGERYLKNSIESILNQKYKDFELIIIDDCSSDKSSIIAQNYAQSNANVSYYRNDINLKLPESLNRGFSQATGDYWTWTSCDNFYLPHAFEVLVNKLEENKQVGMVYSSMQLIDEQSQEIGDVEAGPPQDLILRNVVGACFLYRGAIAKKIGSYNKDMFLCEDYEYWLRIAQVSQIVPINVCLYRYRSHSKSLSYNHEKEIIEKGINVQKFYYPFFIKTRGRAALFYAHLRARDIYNPYRQFYLIIVLYYSPLIFFRELLGLIKRRLQ
ncbi:MAG: hypothetical protein K0R76_420 [Alphaproteobacteria bacterium]|jgi:glycosyltransferase involved in cell wall biosynthesis|nr:hypothetical protein [Alphaproteobacteria bacterium]